MEKIKKRAKIWLCVAIALMFISMIGVSVVQTSSGKVDISELYFETDEGYTMCANLYVPEGATAENPAPAIVASHGAYNNKEMQDANCVELARRGYVVLAIDQPGHGNTDLYSGSNGVYQGVLALSRMPYVDTTRIGVTGHSCLLYTSLRPLPGHGERRGRKADAAARRRRRVCEQFPDAVPERPVGRGGAPPCLHRDDGSGRGVPSRFGRRLLEGHGGHPAEPPDGPDLPARDVRRQPRRTQKGLAKSP